MGLFFDARPQNELHEPMTSKDCKWSHQPSTHTRNPVRRCSVFSVKFWYGRASENHSPSLESCKQMYMIHFGFEVNWVPHLQTKKTLFWVIHQLGLIWLLVMVPKTRSCHIRKSPKPPQSPDLMTQRSCTHAKMQRHRANKVGGHFLQECTNTLPSRHQTPRG